MPHALTGRKSHKTVMTGFKSVTNNLLQQGLKNSSAIFDRLKEVGYKGSLSRVKRSVIANKNLLPPVRYVVQPHGNRGLRFFTKPEETFQIVHLLF